MKKIYVSLLGLLVCLQLFAQTYVYQKVETPLSDWSGEYLIVKEIDSLSTGVVFDGSLKSLDIKHNCFRVSISDDRIASTAQTDAATFTITSKGNGNYSIRSHSGFYIGYNKADSANLKFDTTDKYVNTIAFESDTTTKVKITGAGGFVLRYNNNVTSDRFRYYAVGKKKGIHLYKKIVLTGVDETDKTDEVVIDGRLYFLPEGFYIQGGKLIYRKPIE